MEAQDLKLRVNLRNYMVYGKKGYGVVMVVNGNGAEYYHYSRLGCLKADTLDNEEVSHSLSGS